jgi:nitrite reductase/ring-hydroxylating ferredoxin subunit
MDKQLISIGRVQDFDELSSKIVTVEKRSIGVYKFNNKFFAYLNRCPHQGGPACEGSVLGKTECEVKDGRIIRKYVSTEKYNIICPWHGVEYDLVTGKCIGNENNRLFPFEVVVQGEDVLLRVR